MLDLALGIISFALTIMVFSYIFGDNFFFRLAAYLLVGISSGYTVLILITKVILPYLVTPLLYGSTQDRFLAVIPLILSIMLGLMIFPRLTKVGRLPLAIVIAIIAALTVGGVTLGTIIPQMLGAIGLFSPDLLQQNEGQLWLRWVDAAIMLIGVITTLLYFHFSISKKDHKDQKNRSFNTASKIGQVFIGITLGALFAGIYASALIALISRISDIKNIFILLFGL